MTPGPLLWLDEDHSPAEAATVALQLGDRAVTMPDAARPLLAAVLGHQGEFTPETLAAEPGHGLDAESVRVILTALYREGVVAHGPL